MVMGERIKRTTGLATARMNRDAGTTHPDDEATDAERDAPAADAPRAGDAAHRGATGAGGS